MREHAREGGRGDPRVFTIPPGAPFLPTLVDALLGDRIVPGFAAAGPLGLADATIYLPTRRAARALAATLAERLGSAGTFLPRILPLGDLDALETEALLDDPGVDSPGAGPPAIDPLTRRFILTRLILAWGRAVRSADPSPDAEVDPTEPPLIATSPVEAWYLSGELAALLDEMLLAGLEGRDLASLATEAFDRYWGITLDFLRIATEHWPAILAERNRVDPATRRERLIAGEIARLSAGRHRGPAIVAGVVGDEPLTVGLAAAIARMAQGAVVLPGLDLRLDQPGWDRLALADGSPGHPQAALRRMLDAIGVARSDVVTLGQVSNTCEARTHLISEALRPAETTEAWRDLLAGTSLDLDAATDRIGVIEAADEREEALALAIALREALEGSGSAVLVTPDRTLARRVREELTRWGVEIDDSGGEALAATPAGALARLMLDCVGADFDPLAVLALLAHPAVRLGRRRSTVDRLRRRAELVLLRGIVRPGALADPQGLMAEVRRRRDDPAERGPVRRLTDDELAGLTALFGELAATLGPLAALSPATTVESWIVAHEDALTALIRTETGVSALGGADGAALATLFTDLPVAAEGGIPLARAGYAALFGRIAAETPVRGPARSHPRLKILGLLEMRLLDADRVLLGGLDEAIWPPQVKTDAFLNRPMRVALGLALPERRIGQAAHDFAMAMGHPEVIISRARRRGGSPTVPSRFLQRLAAVSGDRWATCRSRGRVYLDLARAIDRPERAIVIRRPAPKPPVALRPTRLSVTRVETLRRDPYAIYAERILELRPLDPIGASVGPREWGTAFHGVLRAFVERVGHGPAPPDALEDLIRGAQTAFEPLMHEPHTRAFLQPRLERWAASFHAWDSIRRSGLTGLHAEAEGRLVIGLADGTNFELTASADRIERDRTGAIRIVDYKTGAAPSVKEVGAGFAPQLTLEAAIALGGGFAALDAVCVVDEALYVKFGTGRELALTPLKWDDRRLDEVVTEHLQGLQDLLDAFRDPATGYVARPFPQFTTRFGDYDHLSRVKEWSATGGLGDPSVESGAE